MAHRRRSGTRRGMPSHAPPETDAPSCNEGNKCRSLRLRRSRSAHAAFAGGEIPHRRAPHPPVSSALVLPRRGNGGTNLSGHLPGAQRSERLLPPVGAGSRRLRQHSLGLSRHSSLRRHFVILPETARFRDDRHSGDLRPLHQGTFRERGPTGMPSRRSAEDG